LASADQPSPIGQAGSSDLGALSPGIAASMPQG
jgi:hypothetical protein